MVILIISNPSTPFVVVTTRLSNKPASASKCKSTAWFPMAVQHRGVDGASVVGGGEDEEGKEQIPKGTLPRLKSESDGMSIQDFMAFILFDAIFGVPGERGLRDG